MDGWTVSKRITLQVLHLLRVTTTAGTGSCHCVLSGRRWNNFEIREAIVGFRLRAMHLPETQSDVLSIVRDNYTTEKCLPPMLKVPFFGCASRRVNLSVNDKLEE